MLAGIYSKERHVNPRSLAEQLTLEQFGLGGKGDKWLEYHEKDHSVYVRRGGRSVLADLPLQDLFCQRRLVAYDGPNLCVQWAAVPRILLRHTNIKVVPM